MALAGAQAVAKTRVFLHRVAKELAAAPMALPPRVSSAAERLMTLGIRRQQGRSVPFRDRDPRELFFGPKE